jgi:hypothetical protein
MTVSVNLNLGGLGGGGVGKAAKAGCGSIFGVLFGILLVPLGFYLVYHGEARLVNHGKVFEGVEMASPEGAANVTGLVKIKGQPVGQFLSHARWDSQALYFRNSVEEYEREEDADGEVDYDWNQVSSDSKWADFRIGTIKVQPENANPVGEETVYEGYKPTFAQDFSVDAMGRSPEVGDQRLEVEVLNAAKEIIVLGEMRSGSISGGSTFVVSTLGDTATAGALKTEYKITYWLMKGGAVLAIWFGILAIFGPLTTIVGYIPLIGEKVSGVLVMAALVFAIVAVGIVTVFLKLFWILVAGVVIVLAILIWRGFATPRERPSAQAPTPAVPVQAAAPQAPPPAAVPRPTTAEEEDRGRSPKVTVPLTAAAQAGDLKCPGCGAKITRSDNFCTECGAKLDEGKLV